MQPGAWAAACLRGNPARSPSRLNPHAAGTERSPTRPGRSAPADSRAKTGVSSTRTPVWSDEVHPEGTVEHRGEDPEDEDDVYEHEPLLPEQRVPYGNHPVVPIVEHTDHLIPFTCAGGHRLIVSFPTSGTRNFDIAGPEGVSQSTQPW